MMRRPWRAEREQATRPATLPAIAHDEAGPEPKSSRPRLKAWAIARKNTALSAMPRRSWGEMRGVFMRRAYDRGGRPVIGPGVDLGLILASTRSSAGPRLRRALK